MEKITSMTESMELDGEKKPRKKKSGRISEVNIKHDFSYFKLTFIMTPIFTVFIWDINRSDKVLACCKRKLTKTGKFHKSKERERKERVQRYMRYTYFDIVLNFSK